MKRENAAVDWEAAGKEKWDIVVTFQFLQYKKSTAHSQRMSLRAGIKYINDLERKYRRMAKITFINQAIKERWKSPEGPRNLGNWATQWQMILVHKYRIKDESHELCMQFSEQIVVILKNTWKVLSKQEK